MLVAAIGAAGASPAAAQQLASEVLVDRDMTVGAGATVGATIGGLVAHAEDATVPHRLFAEEGTSRRTANFAYRFLKFVFFDTPQEHLLLVFDHEVFGHGARLRERFDGPIEYRIAAPEPYGDGTGATSFVFDREPTPYELLAVTAGGMESTGVAAATVAERAFVEQRMSPRDAYRYVTFELDTLRYIASTDEDEEPGHDVADFLHTYNDLATAAGAPTLSVRRLKREALISLANPIAAYAAFGVARYWWNGDTNIPVPAISVGGVRYLPLFRYRLTPFGTEWALVNAFAGRTHPTEVELRIGRATLSTPWGIGARQRRVAAFGGWTLDAAVDIWKQPPVDDTNPRRIVLDARLGGRVRGRLSHPVVPVWFSTSRASVIVEVGAKSGGYVPGEPLRGGIVARAGVGIPLP